MNRIIYYLEFCLITFFLGCTNPERGLNRLIKNALLDEHITKDEFFAIKEYMASSLYSESQDLGDEYIYTKIDEVALKLNKRGRNPLSYPPSIWQSEDRSEEEQNSGKQLVYNVYVENSASMDGYMNELTEFKEALLHIFTKISGKEEGLKFYFINADTFAIDKEIDEFITYLSPKSMRGKGKRGNTEINKLIKTVVSRYQEDQQPAILVSDYIFSMNKLASNQPNLPMIKATLEVAFQNVEKENDAILILKYSSQFNGVYYDYLNQPKQLYAKRPYYIWVLASKEDVTKFIEKYYISNSTGYQDYFVISSSSQNELPFYSLLSKSFKNGRFKICRDKKQKICLEDIKQSKSRKNDSFQFSVAVDLSKVPVREEYKLNPNNYTVISETDDLIEVKDVKTIKEISNNDERFRGSATHLIVLGFDLKEINKGEQVIELKMYNRIPDWVSASTTMDDTQIDDNSNASTLNKTFGFQYLISGVFEAFNPDIQNASFWNIPIIIRNN